MKIFFFLKYSTHFLSLFFSYFSFFPFSVRFQGNFSCNFFYLYHKSLHSHIHGYEKMCFNSIIFIWLHPLEISCLYCINFLFIHLLHISIICGLLSFFCHIHFLSHTHTHSHTRTHIIVSLYKL